MPATPAPAAVDLSDEPIVEHLLFLPPNQVTARRLRGELGAAGVAADEDRVGLRVAVGDLDWRGLLEGLADALSGFELRDTRVAVLPRGADERARRKAVAVAKPLAIILETYSDGWLCGVLERTALQAHFQPLIQYPPGRVHGYECLVRGAGADGAPIPPARLFAAAARLDLTYLLDRQACRAAVAAAADIGFSNVQYFINVMPAGIDRPAAFAAAALAAVDIGGLRADQFTIEVVGADAFADRARLGQIVDAFHDAGFGVSLDDVGAAGAASPFFEEHLKPEYVKLDAALCRRAAENPADGDLVRRLVEAARARGAVTVAKGIETEEQLRFAIDAGIEVTQGNVHAPPAATPLESADEDQVLRRARRTAILAG